MNMNKMCPSNRMMIIDQIASLSQSTITIKCRKNRTPTNNPTRIKSVSPRMGGWQKMSIVIKVITT
jgi:hypothetical protein